MVMAEIHCKKFNDDNKSRIISYPVIKFLKYPEDKKAKNIKSSMSDNSNVQI
jgi:hypothetical protein